MQLMPNMVGGPLRRLGSAVENAMEVMRFGGLETGEEAADFDVVATERMYRLRRYYADDGAERGPAVLLVPPMMLSAEVYDVSPSASAVTTLREHGVDPWVVDFGAPEREEGGLERNLTDHVLAVSDAVDRVHKITGQDLHLGGYSQGGMFCYQATAYRRSKGIASLITFGSPVDTHGALPLGIPEQVASRGAALVADQLGRRAVPAWMSRTGFRLLDPVKSLRQRFDFVRQLHDREALLPRERQRRFLMAEGWVAWPGPALAEFMTQFVAHNRMLSGGFVIDERLVTLADITCPVLSFVGEVDEIAPAPAVRAITRAAPRSEVYEVSLRAGHFGLVVGSSATTTTWPAVAEWAHWREGDGEMPESAHRIETAAAGNGDAGGPGIGYRLELAAGAGSGLARSIIGTATRTAENVRELTSVAVAQLPQLNRLERVSPGTRISLGLLLDEQAKRSPEGINFLFEDRAYSHAAVKGRIDAVVRGLLSLGVRQGEHVGVLMETRPSALTVVAALNRLGAVAVLMRPDGPIEREAELGQIGRIVTDPDQAERVTGAVSAKVLVLGGGGEERDLGITGVIDMERIDPDEVDPPGWYRANPGRAGDLAFVLFTGEGQRTRAKAITNARWVLSAFGTASSANLSPADTVYSVTPVHHPSGLLMTMGGAVAGGARIALARTFDPATFWDEVRRYGATVVSYTWTLLHDVVEADPQPGEHHHPVRMFIGSGMPTGMWRRVTTRFAPARVLEFYASTEGDAVLVNLSGAKPGSKGRPLPGSTEVCLARYDVDAGKLAEGRDGFAIRCEDGEPGILLARSRPDMISTTASPLRGVFSRDDAWLSTGDMFRRDEDGDYWMVDHVPALIPTEHGMVAAFPIQDALADVDAIDLSVIYGVPGASAGKQVAVAAVTVRGDRALKPGDLARALDVLPLDERPDVIRVVKEIPVTTWFRPVTAGLRKAGLPASAKQGPIWYLDPGKGTYRKLTPAVRKRLLGES